MSDKKSVTVTLTDHHQRVFKSTDDVTYEYEVGAQNGCLAIIEKRAGNPDGLITVGDTEEVFEVFAAAVWFSVR